MNKMPTGVIYSIVCNETGEVYYGSTTKTADERSRKHYNSFNAWKEGKYDYCSSFQIIERGNYTVNTVDTIDFETKKELHERERFWIENNECINRKLPAQTSEERKEYLLLFSRTEKRREQQRIWAENNKEKMREYARRHREKKKNGREPPPHQQLYESQGEL